MDADATTATDPSPDVMYNPFAPGFAADPYPQYAAIRADGRVHRNPLGLRVLSHYDDCFELLRLHGTSVDERKATNVLRPELPDDLPQQMRERSVSILNVDPPDHTRMRRLVSSAFTIRRVERLREHVRHLVTGLLDEVAAAGREGEPVDLIARFAFPLPFIVISELLGMPEGDRDQLRAWSHEMTKSLEPLVDDDTLRRVAAAGEQMIAHINEAIEWKRHNPADDLLSAMIAAEEDGERLSPDELLENVVLLYLAGHETTVNLIGNGTMALLNHRDQLERLVADPGLDANAVDELLRYDSPVQVSRRIATSAIEIAGEAIGEGELVLTLLGSSNRDEAKWGPTAADLDLGREGAGSHLSFGSGIHHCLGSALARLEGAEAIAALVRRFPAMELATDQPAWNGRIILRGLDELPVTLSA
ncbi:MAG TPA: cytochrome P450 [Acidimicrobiales bacterium]|nr:cytochrome P450 [Acidimicrobiales bacterium]